jgi:hypothetical protein
MKTSFRLFAVVFFVLFAVHFARAGNFISQVVQGMTPSASFVIQVPGDHFLVIRNFTQEAFDINGNLAARRGQVAVMDRTGLSGIVLTTTLADTDPSDCLEPVNEIIIAGPSTVTVTGADTNCFITYRKGQD